MDDLAIRLVSKFAEVGDIVLINENNLSCGGTMLKVDTVGFSGLVNQQFLPSGYRVLVPVKEVEVTSWIEKVSGPPMSTPSPSERLRVATINKAWDFVRKTVDEVKDIHETVSTYNATYNNWVTKVEFIVNEEKRTVVAIARKVYGGDIVGRGIAKCMDEDVFNVDIGKAIALIKLYGMPHDEDFFFAPQPTEFKEGMRVGPAEPSGLWAPFIVDGLNKYGLIDSDGSWVDREHAVILSDTLVQYEGLKTYV